MSDELAKHDKSNIESLRRLDGDGEPPKPAGGIPWGLMLAAIAVIPIAMYVVGKVGKAAE